MSTQKQKMLAGELYRADDPERQADLLRASRWMDRYNAVNARTPAEREPLLRELFSAVGRNCNVKAPFFCDYGYNIALGDGVFMNFNCVILDICPVSIGELTQIGPGVQILAADHPR